MNVVNEFGSTLVPWQHYRLTHVDGYMFTMPDNQIFNITWLLPDSHRLVIFIIPRHFSLYQIMIFPQSKFSAHLYISHHCSSINPKLLKGV